MNEFSLYLEGATKKYEQKLRDIPYDLQEEIKKEIATLFGIFDEDGSGDIDKYELMKAYQGLGHEMDEFKAVEMIKQVDTDGNGTIDR